MEHFTKKVLLPLIALVLSSAPGLAQQVITIFHGTTLDQVGSVVGGIQNVGNPSNMAGPGLYVSPLEDVAQSIANQKARFNVVDGFSWPFNQGYVLRGVLTDGATVGEFFVDQTAEFTNIAKGIIGRDIDNPSVQAQLMQFDILKITGTSSSPNTPFYVLHESANQFVAWENAAAADLSLVTTDAHIAQIEQAMQTMAQESMNMIAAEGDPISPGTIQGLGNAVGQAVQNCGKVCGVSLALSTVWTQLKVGLQMTTAQVADGANQVGAFLESSAGIGSVMSAAAIYGSVTLCDKTLDNLCSSNINTSLSSFIFGPATSTGPTLTSQTFNPYTGAVERDFSDGSVTWTWPKLGIVTGVDASGQGYVQDPDSGIVSLATPIDGRDAKTSQIMQVNFSGQIEYLTQAGFSDTLPDGQDAVTAINALNGVTSQGTAVLPPALFQVPAIVPVLDSSGKPTPTAPPDQSGTSTTTGTTPQGNQYTTTVQKDSSGNIVSENTVVFGTNYTTSKNDLTGTSLTIQRNPDGSTSIFNCIQNGTVCATDSGIVNFDDGWGGKNPYDASNQTFTLTMPGGGGGGGGALLNAPGDPTVGIGGCTELGC